MLVRYCIYVNPIIEDWQSGQTFTPLVSPAGTEVDATMTLPGHHLPVTHISFLLSIETKHLLCLSQPQP